MNHFARSGADGISVLGGIIVKPDAASRIGFHQMRDHLGDDMARLGQYGSAKVAGVATMGTTGTGLTKIEPKRKPVTYGKPTRGRR